MNWLEIEGKIRTGVLTPNTSYGAYLIMKVSHRGYGLDAAPSEVSVAVGGRVLQRGKAYLGQKDEKKVEMETLFYGNRRDMFRNRVIQLEQLEEEGEHGGIIPVPGKRDDGWMEIELGEFFSGGGDVEIKMGLREVGYQLKGGLVVEGIEVRPKQTQSTQKQNVEHR